jgi:hypothetical protein
MYSFFGLRLRIALLWVMTQRAVVISCRRCGITYQTLADKTDWLTRNVGEKVPLLAA